MTEHGPGRASVGCVRAKRTRGAASVEYTVVTFAVVVSLFVVPVNPAGDTAVGFLLKALRLFQDNSTYLLSLP